MDAKTLAAQLNGIEYPVRISKELEAQAKAAGLVIVFGLSDDLMEFRGAIYDEMGAYEGATALVDTKGLLPERDQITEDDDLQAYFERKPHAVEIEQIWSDHGPLCWTHDTAIPHETFEIKEDGEVNSTGIVFALADAKPDSGSLVCCECKAVFTEADFQRPGEDPRNEYPLVCPKCGSVDSIPKPKVWELE